MRSMLIQASSIEKAVEKAWIGAGKPTEFTIKILDFGEKGFLGFTKRQAIVSIFYEPYKQTSISKPQPPVKKQAQKEEPRRKPITPGRPSTPIRPVTRPAQPVQAPTKTSPEEEFVFWTNELVNDATTWLKETVSLLGIQTTVKSHVNKKVLSVNFDNPIMGTHEEERMLFPALSALVMQFIRKKNKKKFHGFQLVLSSKRQDDK